jgi:hypothetical protein
LASFFNSVRNAFLEELQDKICRLYSMPSNYTDVNQRVRIQTSEELRNFIAECAALSSGGIPHSNQLFVFNEDSSPTKLPTIHAMKFKSPYSQSSSAPSSSGSNRSQKAASECRERDSNSCVFCGYLDYSNRCAAHIFEIDVYNRMHKEERKKHLTLFGLQDINSLANMLSLCTNCHTKFDAPYLIGILPNEHCLVVSPRIMGSEYVTQGGIPFSKLDGNKLSFNGSTHFHPSEELLEYRFSFFKNSTSQEDIVVEGEGKGPLCKSQDKKKKNKRIFSSLEQTPDITKWFKKCPAFEPQSSSAGCKLCGLSLEKH